MSTLYSDFIALLRQDNNDFPMRRFETADGDGATSVYNIQNPKIYEGSYTVKVGGVAQVESTDYDLYPDVGQFVFRSGHIPAAGNDNISFEYQSVILRDADYLDIINQTLQQLRRKLWIEAVDEVTLSTVTDQNDYSLAAVKTAGSYTDVIYVIDFQIKEVSNAPVPPVGDDLVTNPWRDVRTVTNVKFYRDLQVLRTRPAFNSTGFPLRVSLIRAYVQGTTVGAVFEPQQRYWPVLRKFCQVEYLNRFVSWILKNSLTAVSKEKTYENINDLKKLSTATLQESEMMLKIIRPQKPGMAIPVAIAGIGNP